MPSSSKSQQRFFGVVKAMQKGDIPKKGEAGKAAKSMDKDDVDDFASTKHKGLPNKVKRESRVKSLIRKMVREIMAESTVRISTMKDVSFAGRDRLALYGKKGKVGLDRKSVSALVKAVRNVLGRSFTAHEVKETKLNEAKMVTLPNGVKVKIEFKGITLQAKGKKPVFLDRSEMMTFFKATQKYMKQGLNAGKVKEGFAGGLPKSKRKSFDNVRRKQSEVLGYKLTGKDDMKVETDDATVHEGKNKGLWANIHAKRKRGEEPAEPGDKDYPKTLDIEGKLKEDYKNSKWEVYVGDDAYGKNRKVVKVAKSKRAATILYNKLIKTDKYFEVGMRAVREGKITEAKEPLWDKDSVKNVIKQIQKGIKVPYADGLGLGALSRRDEHPAIMGKISVDDKKTWPNGYLENSRWALVRIEADGTIDTVRMNGYGDFKTRKKVPILRKSKNKSIKQIIDRLGKYFTVVRLKYPDNK